MLTAANHWSQLWAAVNQFRSPKCFARKRRERLILFFVVGLCFWMVRLENFCAQSSRGFQTMAVATEENRFEAMLPNGIALQNHDCSTTAMGVKHQSSLPGHTSQSARYMH